jgi:hypothetical protein
LIAVGLVLVIGGGYLARLGTDRGNWTRAASARYLLLRGLRREVPHLAPGTTLIAGGFPLFEEPGVPVFAASWDLNGAVQLLWHDDSLHAWPESKGTLECGASGIGVTRISAGLLARYGHTVLVNVAGGATAAIDSPAECRELAQSA